MDYRSILKTQLEQRKLINSRFSLRSLAKKIELSASKLSEVMNGKKPLSRDRAKVIADKLGLRDLEREIFILSTEIGDSAEAKTRLKNLVTEMSAKKTEQKNAWYFGAVKAIQEEGLDPADFLDNLGLTSLQIENAQRFLKRIKRYYPERERLSYDSSSLVSRLQDDILSSSEDQFLEFMFLDESDIFEMKKEISALFRKYSVKGKKNKNRKLRWIYFTQFPLTRNG